MAVPKRRKSVSKRKMKYYVLLKKKITNVPYISCKYCNAWVAHSKVCNVCRFM